MIDWQRVIVLSGPSGVGKDTVLAKWQDVNPSIQRVVSWTTRPPRPGEVDAKDYRFISTSIFEATALAGGFLEHKMVHGNWYGTPLLGLRRLTQQGKLPVLKIDVQGALDVMEAHPEVLSIFLLPPNGYELERRLRSRASDSNDQIERRLKTAKLEIAQATRYKHQVVNDDIDAAVADLERLVAGLK